MLVAPSVVAVLILFRISGQELVKVNHLALGIVYNCDSIHGTEWLLIGIVKDGHLAVGSVLP